MLCPELAAKFSIAQVVEESACAFVVVSRRVLVVAHLSFLSVWLAPLLTWCILSIPAG